MRFVRTAENLFGLPAGFKRTEYLESSGTQYIDTGVREDTTCIINMQATRTTATTQVVLANTLEGTRTKWFGTAGNTNYYSVGGSSGVSSVSATTRKECVVTFTNMYSTTSSSVSFYFKDDPANVYTRSDTISGGITLTNICVGSSVSLYPSYVKLFGLKIYNTSNVLLRDFIPCIDPLGVACMYDLVGKKPYYNQGTGTFTVGRQVIPVEYLESTGTQYIDTGYKPINTTGHYMEMSYSTLNNAVAFGTMVSGNGVVGPYYDRGMLWTRWGASEPNTSATIVANTKYKVYLNYKNDRISKVDDVVISNNLPSFTAGAYGNLTLFRRNYSAAYAYFTGKIYRYQMTDGSDLIRDFIPCKDENNVGFMFDKVSGTCYLNAGTGAFSVGENKYTSKLRLIRDAIRIPAGYTRVEYLESTGEQRIDTGYIPNQNTTIEFNIQLTSTSTNWAMITGRRSIIGTDTFFYMQFTNSQYFSNSALWFVFGPQANTTALAYPNPLNEHVITISVPEQKIIVDGNTTSFTGSIQSGNNYPLNVFSSLNANGTVSTGQPLKLYYYKIYDNDTLVRSFIPVRDSNNVGYMYDEVTGQIFGNAGSGSFVVGNDLPTAKVRFIQDVLPIEYSPLKYLESTGTQYIDTGLFVGQGYGCHIKLYPTNTSGTSSFVGGGESNNTNEYAVYCYMDNAFIRNGTNNSINTSGTVVSSNVKLQGIEIQHQGDSVIWTFANGYTLTETLSSNKWSVVDSPYKLVLFAMNRGNTINPTQGKFSFIKIFRYGVPVRDFYPALRKSDNKPGMYDRITKQFYVNAATSGNDFNYG